MANGYYPDRYLIYVNPVFCMTIHIDLINRDLLQVILSSLLSTCQSGLS